MELPIAEIQKYLKILFKRRRLFIILSLCIMSVIIWGSYALPKKYKAESTIFIEKNVIKELIKDIAITPSMEDRVRVLRYAMLSRSLILKVFNDVGLSSKARNDKELETMIEDYQKRTQLTVKGNDLFIVSILDKDPKMAMDYINTLVRRYIEDNLSSKREEAYGADRFLVEQIAAMKEKLDKAEDAVTKYRQEKGIYLLTDEKGLIDSIRAYKEQIDQLKGMRNELIASHRSITKQLENIKPYTVSILKHTENKNIKVLEKRLNDLLVRYTENYPEVIRLKTEIEILKKQDTGKKVDPESNAEPDQSAINPVYQELQQKSLELEAQISGIDAKIRQMQGLVASKEGELKHIPENKRKLMELERDRDAQKELYQKLLARQGQSEISRQMEVQDKTTTFKVVDPAILPTKPFSPNRIKMFLLGIFLGLSGGVFGVFIREFMDGSVKEVKTIKELGIQVLAVIPKIFNEYEQKEIARKDRLVYIIAGSYFLVICATIIIEALGFSYIDFIVSHIKIGAALDKITYIAKVNF